MARKKTKKTYTIRFWAESWTDIKVEAKSEEEAYELADEMYNNGEYSDEDTGFENTYCECVDGEDEEE